MFIRDPDRNVIELDAYAGEEPEARGGDNGPPAIGRIHSRGIRSPGARGATGLHPHFALASDEGNPSCRSSGTGRGRMDQAVLALLERDPITGARTWKPFDWRMMNLHHRRGSSSGPVSKAKSVDRVCSGCRSNACTTEVISCSPAISAISPAVCTPSPALTDADLGTRSPQPHLLR